MNHKVCFLHNRYTGSILKVHVRLTLLSPEPNGQYTTDFCILFSYTARQIKYPLMTRRGPGIEHKSPDPEVADSNPISGLMEIFTINWRNITHLNSTLME